MPVQLVIRLCFASPMERDVWLCEHLPEALLPGSPEATGHPVPSALRIVRLEGAD